MADNSEPAFPSLDNNGRGLQARFFGMSIRDYFAAAALPQAVADYGEPLHSSQNRQRLDMGNPVLPYAAKAIGTREEIIARQAYKYADAMLKARAEEENNNG